MELSSGQQRLLFVVVVLLLAGLGIYLLGPASHHKASAAPTTSASSVPVVSATSPPATTAPPPTVQAGSPATSPATSPGTSADGGAGADIYQWLPFTRQDLTQAAQVTLAFAVDYDTFTYTEPAAAYGKKMADVATSELVATLESNYATPAIATQRDAQKQVSTSSGEIASIRSFDSGSITFLVNIAQQLTVSANTKTSTSGYAVTVVTGGTGWQVNDIELATAGNH